MLRALDPYKWPIAVVVSVALAAWAALEIAVLVLELDPSTVEAVMSVRTWVATAAGALGAVLVPLLAKDSDGDGIPDVIDSSPRGES